MRHGSRLRTPVWLLAVLAALVVTRIVLVDRNIGTYVACPGCFDSSVIAADAPVFVAVAGLLLLGGLISAGWVGRLLHLVAGLTVLAYATDLFVFRFYNTRLFVSDFRLFLVEPAAVWNQLSSGLGGAVQGVVAMGTTALVLAWLVWAHPVRSRLQRALLLAFVALGLLSAAIIRPPVYVNDWATENVFEANLSTSVHTPYSEETAAAVLATRPPARVVTGPADGARRNVIVLMLESWSAWHSAAWGGEENWTPGLDAAAARGTAFTDFHAIGFSTDKGLVGILAGQQVWSPFLHWLETPPFHSMWGVKRTLPRAFSPHGYHTAFLTSGPLTLYLKGEWLGDLGFDEVEGNEHAFYDSEPRFAFGAASDRALYRRAAAWLDAAASPYLLVLETVTTHQPYTDPETGQRSLQGAMKFADRAFVDFLADLDRRDFFADGILLVVSDHRSMTPVPSRELDRWGPAALSRVPAFAIGPGFEPGTSNRRLHSQSDLVPSFELWLGGRTSLESHQDVMFGRAPAAAGPDEAATGRCLFHSRIDLRGRVDVHCDSGYGQVRLEGDDSAFVGAPGIGPGLQRDVIDTLAVLRLQGLERHRRRETLLAGEPVD